LEGTTSGQPELPGELARRVTYLLGRVAAAAGRRAGAKLAASGLGIDPRHYAVLAVADSAADMSQRMIADVLGIDRATVVALADGLERLGLAERRRSGVDRRANAVRVTEHGRQVLATAGQAMDECDREFLAALTAADRSELARLLALLLT